MPPQNYLFFGYLINKAKGIITDSGNVAEEATFLGIPCITLNTYAEHPETWRMGTNELVGEDPAELAKAMDTLMKGEWKRTYSRTHCTNPYRQIISPYIPFIISQHTNFSFVPGN